MTGSGGCCCAKANHRSNATDRNKEEPLSLQLLAHFVIRYDSCLIIPSASLLNSPQEKSGTQKRDHHPSQKNHEIIYIKLQTRAVHVHQSKSTAKMCKR